MTDPDHRLAGRARRGDRRALEALYERYRGRLFGFLRKMLGSPTLAEDVFQETWIKAMQALPRYRPAAGAFRPWLYRVASNAAVDCLRREGRRAGPELDAPVAGDPEGERAVDRLPAPDPGPEQAGVGAAIGRDLDAALARLNERQRAAVLLRHQQGLSYPELARALGVPEGTAKTLVHRGVIVLREQLAEWSDERSEL